MIIKPLEIRDEGTCIAAIAIRMVADGPVEDAYLWREGYPRDGSGVVLMRLSDQKATSDPYEWPGLTGGTRTMLAAHVYIERHFDDLAAGDVVDVRVPMGLRDGPVAPEIWMGQR